MMLRFGIAFRFMIFICKSKGRVFKYVCTLVLSPLSLGLILYFFISFCWPFLVICQDLKVSKLGSQELRRVNSFQETVNSSQGAILKVICYHVCSCQGVLSEAKPIWEAGSPGRFYGRIFSLMLCDETEKSAFICGVLPVSGETVRNLSPLPCFTVTFISQPLAWL